MFPGGVLVQLTDEGERLAEESRRAVIADDDAFLEPLSSRQRDSVAAAPKPAPLARGARLSGPQVAIA